MVAEAMEEYVLSSAEAAHKDIGEQAPMGFIALGEYFHDGNFYHSCNQKHPSFPSQNFLENTNWETADVHMSVAEEAIIKARDRFNYPL